MISSAAALLSFFFQTTWLVLGCTKSSSYRLLAESFGSCHLAENNTIITITTLLAAFF
jgi:hypothetical protein